MNNIFWGRDFRGELTHKHVEIFFVAISLYVGVVAAVIPFPVSVLAGGLPFFVLFLLYPLPIVFIGVWICSGIFLNFTPLGTSGKIVVLGPLLIVGGSLLGYFVRLFCGDIKSSGRQGLYDEDVVKFLSLALVFYAAIQAVVSISIRHCDILDVMSEFAPVAMWSILCLWPTSMESSEERNKILFFAFIGFVSSLVVIFQARLSVPLMVGGRVESLKTLTSVYSDVTRAVTDNIHFVVLLSLLIPAFVVRFRSYYLISVLVGFLCLAAIYFQYGRALWITYFVALVVFCFIALNKNQLIRLIFLALCLVFVLSAILSFAEVPALQAGIDRLFSVGAEVSSGSSFDWRIWENQTAIKKIYESPVFGIGPGVHYRRVVDPGTFAAQTRYMHNSYLYFMMKYGIFGFCMIATVIFLVLKRLYKLISLMRRGTWERLYATGLFAFLIMFVLISINQPEFISVMSSLTLVFAVWLALVIDLSWANKPKIEVAVR